MLLRAPYATSGSSGGFQAEVNTSFQKLMHAEISRAIQSSFRLTSTDVDIFGLWPFNATGGRLDFSRSETKVRVWNGRA